MKKYMLRNLLVRDTQIDYCYATFAFFLESNANGFCTFRFRQTTFTSAFINIVKNNTQGREKEDDAIEKQIGGKLLMTVRVFEKTKVYCKVCS